MPRRNQVALAAPTATTVHTETAPTEGRPRRKCRTDEPSTDNTQQPAAGKTKAGQTKAAKTKKSRARGNAAVGLAQRPVEPTQWVAQPPPPAEGSLPPFLRRKWDLLKAAQVPAPEEGAVERD